jgi:cysteinyl-tRNA synthetase
VPWHALSVQRVKHPNKLGDHTSDPDAHDVSFLVLFEGWPDDTERLHASIERHSDGDWELVIVDNPGDDAASERVAALGRTLHVPLRDPVGYGAGRNLAFRLATGRIVCVVDTSVELTDDVLPHLTSALADEHVGLVGRWGISSDDGFAFEEAEGPDVDGVEGYFMAMRRADLAHTGLFDPKFRFYRNADLDFSFRVRDAKLRTVIDAGLPLERHEHRLWEHTSAEQREELSRKNFFRFRDHWGERADLFTRR